MSARSPFPFAAWLSGCPARSRSISPTSPTKADTGRPRFTMRSTAACTSSPAFPAARSSLQSRPTLARSRGIGSIPTSEQASTNAPTKSPAVGPRTISPRIGPGLARSVTAAAVAAASMFSVFLFSCFPFSVFLAATRRDSPRLAANSELVRSTVGAGGTSTAVVTPGHESLWTQHPR